MSARVVTLFIGPFASRCGACDGNANPKEKAHLMEDWPGDGCGAVFTHVAGDGPSRDPGAWAMRPDLTIHEDPS